MTNEMMHGVRDGQEEGDLITFRACHIGEQKGQEPPLHRFDAKDESGEIPHELAVAFGSHMAGWGQEEVKLA